MHCAEPKRTRAFTASVILSVLLASICAEGAHAQQEPPTVIPRGGPPAIGTAAIPYNTWLLYPSLNLFTQYSNNYFLSPTAKIPGWSFGETPSITAEWSNGIHTTTLFSTFTHLDYPTQNEVNTNDGEATFTQAYSPLRDLTFTFLGDYSHYTIAPSLTSAIPAPVTSTAATVLPNGNTILPNGSIVSPSGQIVGQAGPSFNVGALSVVNPYDAYTATSSVQKVFRDGIVTLSASVLRENYEQSASQSRDFTAKTLRENMSFWLGSILYTYSDGAFTTNTNTSPTPNSDAYRVVGGLGTRQFGLLRASAYVGYQGSQAAGFAAAGGIVYGGALTYYPTQLWTITVNADETVNHAPAGALPSTQAINIPAPTPIQVSTSSSTKITTSTLRSEYKIAPQWTANQALGYTNTIFLGTSSWEDAWFAISSLRYDMWQNLSLTWQYQYTSIVSNLPQTSATRNFVSMSASYKF
jgi:Putative beta-barrel porin 2